MTPSEQVLYTDHDHKEWQLPDGSEQEPPRRWRTLHCAFRIPTAEQQPELLEALLAMVFQVQIAMYL